MLPSLCIVQQYKAGVIVISDVCLVLLRNCVYKLSECLVSRLLLPSHSLVQRVFSLLICSLFFCYHICLHVHVYKKWAGKIINFRV